MSADFSEPNQPIGGVLGDLTPGERTRYLAWWGKVKLLDRLEWAGYALLLGSYLGSRYRPHRDWYSLALLGFVPVFAMRIWLRVLICPHCGATYSGGLITLLQRFSSLSKCYGCDLTRRDLATLEKRKLLVRTLRSR